MSKYKYVNTTGASLVVDTITIAAFDAHYSDTAVPDLDALDGLSVTKIVDGNFVVKPKGLDAVRSVTTYTDSMTLGFIDMGALVRANKGTAMTVTVPPNVDIAFPIGTTIEVENTGAGIVTITAGAGVTLTKVAATLAMSAQHAMVTLRKVAINTWNVNGDLT